MIKSIMVRLGLCVFMLVGCQSQAERNTLDAFNRPTPLIIEGSFDACYLSPSKTYVLFHIFRERRSVIYDLRSAQPLSDTLQLPEAINDWLWLEEDRIMYAGIPSAPLITTTAWLPNNETIIDIPNAIITEVNTLPITDQRDIQDVLGAALTERDRKHRINLSPNGTYIGEGSRIFEYIGPPEYATQRPPMEYLLQPYKGPSLNGTVNEIAEICFDPWKPDNTGVYYLDYQGDQQEKRGGPLRFLPIIPREN